jgi:hypothetical protein
MATKGLGPVIAFSFACGLLSAAYGYFGLEPAPIVALGTLGVPLIAALTWVQSDARTYGIALVQDWGLLAWIGWPLLLPWYSFKTRGRAGWRLVLLLLGLLLGPALAYPLGSVARALSDPASTDDPTVQEVLLLPEAGSAELPGV